MAYATQTQMETAAGGAARLVQLADWDNDGSADSAVVAQCQAEVDALIDSYAGNKFDTPIADPSFAFQSIAAGEYVYWLRAKRGMVADEHKAEHDERVAWLVKLSKGQVLPCNPLPAKSSVVKSSWVDRDTDDVSRANLEGFA